MIRRNEKIIVNLMVFYFFLLFFYGGIIKFTFHNTLLFSLKTYLPELTLALVCVGLLLRKRSWNKTGLCLLLYINLIFSINIITSFSVNSFLMTFRDVYVPIFTSTLLCCVRISDEAHDLFYKKMIKLCSISLVCGALIGVLQYNKGWQWTSAWYTGYSFWGEDSASSMYIMNSGGHVRVPSIVGHNVKFAMASFFQACTILFMYKDKNKFRKDIIQIITVLVAMLNIYISNNKTTLLICFVLLGIWFIKKFPVYARIIIAAMIVFIGAYVTVKLRNSTDFFVSFYDRFSKWSVLIDPTILVNIFLPISLYDFAGNSNTTISVLNYWDNTYLYFAFGFGIFGVCVLIKWIARAYIVIKDSCLEKNRYDYIFFLTMFTAMAAFTTSIVLGRCFFNIYLIVLSFEFGRKKV